MMTARSWGVGGISRSCVGGLMRDRDEFRRRMMALLRLDQQVGEGNKIVLAYSRKKRSASRPAASVIAASGKGGEGEESKRVEGAVVGHEAIDSVVDEEIEMPGLRSEQEEEMGENEVEEGVPQQQPQKRIRGRTCLDCHTTNTPLWRAGPAGPKTLCNACGIRYRKLKRKKSSGSGSVGVRGDGFIIRRHRLVEEDPEQAALQKWQRRKQEGQWLLLQQRHKFEARCGEEELDAAFLLMALSSGLFSRSLHHRHHTRRSHGGGAQSSSSSSTRC